MSEDDLFLDARRFARPAGREYETDSSGRTAPVAVISIGRRRVTASTTSASAPAGARRRRTRRSRPRAADAGVRFD